MSKSKLNIISEKSNKSCDNYSHEAHSDTSSKVSPKNYSGNVGFVTLGCSKNTVDSEVMMGVLNQVGFVPVQDLSLADVIVVNTCAFLESAVKEGIDTILEVSKFKDEGRCRKLIVAGCMVERYKDTLSLELPEVDNFVSTDQLLQIAEVVNQDGTSSKNNLLSEAKRPYFIYDDLSPRVLSTPSHTAYVKIAEGCNRPCAFCIIPKIRGDFRSRPIESITNEVTQLVNSGVKEINFVAQDLTAYGTDFSSNRGIKSELPNLIKKINSINSANEFWLRLFYAYPVGVNEELISIIRDSPRVCDYLDMPLQHISHNVLKSMRRPLGEKGTRALIEQIRKTGPDIKLRTTFVVGFPGETDEDIDILEKYILEGHFMHVGIFTYSQEKEAASFSFDNQVEDHIKEERRSRLMEVQKTVVEKKLTPYLGKNLKVLFEGLHFDSDLLFTGRNSWQGPDADGITIINEVGDRYTKEALDNNGNLELTFLPEIETLKGNFVEVKITEVLGYDLVGELI